MKINLAVAMFILAFALTGCVREIDIENQPATITSVGALSLDDRANVVVPYTLRDLEGDDQIVAIDICDGPDDTCGIAEEATGSTPLDRVPTVPKDSDVLHEFVWQPWCGRWVDQQLETLDVDDEFVVRVTVLPSNDDPVYSEPTSLTALGADVGSCE